MTRHDIELYVMGQYDGDIAALERAIAEDPALAQMVAEEARLEEMLRDAAALATFCPACDDLVRGMRCDSCGAAVKPGGYTVERVLVSNAHGRMYVAHDADGRRVALKELAFVQAPSPAAVAAFEREAKFLRALEHPAIPRFLASFEEGHGVHTRYYLAQELVEGTALDRLDEHWYTEAEITALARQVLGVLAYLQSLSPMVIHRDIKPANLIKRADGSIALVDFGAAHVHGTTAGVTTVGTFGYMPIEQLAGLVDATTDLYALGMTLLHLLTRQEPWRLVHNKVDVNVSPSLRAYLGKLTAADPKARFGNAKEALAALDAPAIAPAKGRRRAVIAAAAGVAFAAAGGGVFAIAHHAHHEPAPVGGIGTLRVDLPFGVVAALSLDGKEIANVLAGQEVPIAAGMHHFTATNGRGVCTVDLTIVANQKSVMQCALPMLEMPAMTAPQPFQRPHLHAPKLVSWSLQHVKIHDFALLAANTCGFSVVIPDNIDIPITLDVKNAPCGQVFDAVLTAQGLAYTLDEDSKLVRIGVERELDKEAFAFRDLGDALPAGGKVDVDFKNAPLRDVLGVIAKSGGDYNVVVPESIDAKVTVKLVGVPWNQALEAVLASQGLWYRYGAEGKLIRVGVRRELDKQDARAR
jgi:hypothetical protein